MLLQFLLTPEVSTGFVSGQEVLVGIFRILFIVSALLYVVFAAVVIRQISIMRDTLQTPFSASLRLVGWAHLVIAVLVFVSFLIIL